MKAHIGVDSRTKLIHSVVATAANVADGRILAGLLHGDETRVWGDQGYRGQQGVICDRAPKANLLPEDKQRVVGGLKVISRSRTAASAS